MSDKKCNGWANYETWNVKLWLDNEQGTYGEALDIARSARDVGYLSRELRVWVEEMTPNLGASMFSDLLNAALSEVDWDEIAESYWEEAHEGDEEEGGEA